MSQDHTHPSALTILTSTVLRNRVPTISTTSAKTNFMRSFKTVGGHDSTQKALKAVSFIVFFDESEIEGGINIDIDTAFLYIIIE